MDWYYSGKYVMCILVVPTDKHFTFNNICMMVQSEDGRLSAVSTSAFDFEGSAQIKPSKATELLNYNNLSYHACR